MRNKINSIKLWFGMASIAAPIGLFLNSPVLKAAGYGCLLIRAILGFLSCILKDKE